MLLKTYSNANIVTLIIINIFMSKKTENRILCAAKGLFWKYGITKVTIEEIAKEAGLSKMTIYRYFKDKKTIASRLMCNLIEDSNSQYTYISNNSSSFKDLLISIIELKRRFIVDMSEDFMRDFISYNDPDFNILLNNFQNDTWALFLKDFEKAKLKGEVRQDVKPEFLFYMINDIRIKTQDPTLLKMFDSVQNLVITLMEQLFYGIIIK